MAVYQTSIIPLAPIWHISLNHVWEECPICHVVNKSQKWVSGSYSFGTEGFWQNLPNCPNCGQIFDWSDEAIEKACKYSKDYPRKDK